MRAPAAQKPAPARPVRHRALTALLSPKTAGLIAKGGKPFLIKVMGVSLSYCMFVFLSHAVQPAEYGQLAFMFALGSLGGVVAVAGQHTLVLRRLPEYVVTARPDRAHGLIRSAYLHVFIGVLVVAAILLFVAEIADRTGVWRQPTLIAWSAALVVPIAFAELQGNILRAYGSIALALIPRDLFWRMSVIIAVVSLSAYSLRPSAWIVIVSAALMVNLAGQTLAGARRVPMAVRVAVPTVDIRAWRASAWWYWLVGIGTMMSGHLAIVVIGVVLTDVETGAFFAAQRTSLMLSLPLVAAAVLGAPAISRNFHGGNIAGVRRVCRLTVLGVFLPSIVGFLVISLFGDRILMVFNAEYRSAHLALVILAVGTMVNALSGPTGFLMTMTGQERLAFRYLMIGNGLGLTLAIAGASFLGIAGAAGGIAVGTTVWNLLVRRWSKQTFGIDPTIAGLLDRGRTPLRRPGAVDRLSGQS